jgi:ribosome recycling factor
MGFDEIQLETEGQLEKSVTALRQEFMRIRTGRANPAMLDHITVEAYGTRTPLKQLAGISVPEPQQLLIKPWDKGTLAAIEKAINASNLGLAPQNDGAVIRLNLPSLSSERRKQLAAQAKEVAEKAKVAMRNARRDGIKAVEAEGKAKKIGEDLVKQAANEITDLLKKYEVQVEATLKEKVADILEL